MHGYLSPLRHALSPEKLEEIRHASIMRGEYPLEQAFLDAAAERLSPEEFHRIAPLSILEDMASAIESGCDDPTAWRIEIPRGTAAALLKRYEAWAKDFAMTPQTHPLQGLLAAAKELLEICRVKCSPLDEVILPDGRTNHAALVDACAAIAAAEELFASRMTQTTQPKPPTNQQQP